MVELPQDMQSHSQSSLSTTYKASSVVLNPQQVKTCVDCGTSKTPLWRGGPAGPKSLCNACGIKSRKRRRALLGLNKEEKKTMKVIKTSDGKVRSSNEGSLLKTKLFGFGREVVALQKRPRSNTSQRRRKFGEVEQAALLLMTISCGSLYA